MDDWDDDDDDLLEELSNKPPREQSFGETQTPIHQQNVFLGTNDGAHRADSGTNDRVKEMEMQILKAQGEASMLRDRLALFEMEKERERKLQMQKDHEQQLQHQTELAQIKADLQKAEDEKKFLAFSGRSNFRASEQSNMNTPNTSNDSADAGIKKRKLQEPQRQVVVLKANRVIVDEVNLFVNATVSHRLAGSELTTLEILNNICLAHVRDFEFKLFKIPHKTPVGKGIFNLLMSHKEASLKLDQYIELLLEGLAILIKEICQNEKECKTAVPFLIALMHHSITFRPSAVHTMALKDLFHFTVDLVRTHRSVLKAPLQKSELELDVAPNIFQYELIRVLTVLYAFDVLEESLKILQSLSVEFQRAFMDKEFQDAVDDISRFSLTISYQPVLNVIFNTVEIFNCIGNMLLESPQLMDTLSVKWWDNIANRLYQILNKRTSNTMQKQPDPGSLHLLKETNVFGLVRNIGNNYNSRFISRLVKENEPSFKPQVIMKEFPEDTGITEKPIDVEWWCVNLKIGIIKLFQKLAAIYRDQALERNMLKVLARLLAQTQEVLLTVLLAQDSENIHVYYELFSQILKLIFHMWNSGQWDLRLIREVESELTVCLWRIVFGGVEEPSKMEMREHKSLVDRFDELRLQQDAELYEDAFDNEVPDFVEREATEQSFMRLREIMGVGVEETTHQMAKTMLEGITSMEDADALYMAMHAGESVDESEQP